MPFCYTLVYLPLRIGELLTGFGELAAAGQPAASADRWLMRTDKRMMEGFPTYGVDTGRHGAWAS